MKKDQLKNFVEVADCGSINKAAEKLYISQPSLSRSIHALEEEMGRKLFIRSNRGITLTPTGNLLYYYARSILNQFRLLERLKKLENEQIYSKLSISVNSIFLHDDMILEFYKRASSAETEIHFIETTAEEVLQNVVQLRSEIGITILNDLQLGVFSKMAEIKEIEVMVMDRKPLYVHVNEKIPLQDSRFVDAEELIEYPYIHLPKDFFSDLNQSLTINKTLLSDFKKMITMSNYHAIINMINHAQAFLLGNQWQIDELRHSNIRSLRFKNCDIMENFVIIKRKREILSSAGEIFLDILKKEYGFM